MKGAKERLVEIIKYYKEARTDEGLADAILKEFVRREDLMVCSKIYDDKSGYVCKCHKNGIKIKDEIEYGGLGEFIDRIVLDSTNCSGIVVKEEK